MTDMSFEEAVKSRRSVRGFLDKRVPDDVLKDVFDIARWAPSGTNVQPWHTCVASGEVRDRMRAEMLHRVSNKEKVITDHPGDGKLGEPWRGRKRACAKVLYDAMGIEWEDKAGRGRAAMRNFELFDAPHAAFLCMNETFGVQSAADVGMYAQTLMLAMTAHGLASCAQGTLRNYPDMVRQEFGLAPELKVLFGISFGYEDPNVPANNARTIRAPLEETVQFAG
ncbi:MAG: nitroreductase [Pseudomonadales bacterium]|nr:nitroreductase [Pseudomonadales bacterium]MDG1444511.1 nitroreductase [Pseudomonadales bacterium]